MNNLEEKRLMQKLSEFLNKNKTSNKSATSYEGKKVSEVGIYAGKDVMSRWLYDQDMELCEAPDSNKMLKMMRENPHLDLSDRRNISKNLYKFSHPFLSAIFTKQFNTVAEHREMTFAKFEHLGTHVHSYMFPIDDLWKTSTKGDVVRHGVNAHFTNDERMDGLVRHITYRHLEAREPIVVARVRNRLTLEKLV